MNGSRWITLVLGLVSCVAAVLVVPEVRCVLGLETTLHRQCGARKASAQGMESDFRPLPDAPTAPDARVAAEVAVGRIRARFLQVENDVEAGRLGEARKDITGVTADSAYATIYLSAVDLPKVRARIYTDDLRTSYQAYYNGNRLAFVFRTVDRLLPDSTRLEEQRYYFDGGRMVRWLDNSRRKVSPSSAEYVDAEQRMRALGERLFQGARSAESMIAF